MEWVANPLARGHQRPALPPARGGCLLGIMRTFESTYGASPARRARLKEMLRLPPEERHRKFLADYDRYYGGGAAAAAERARVIRAPVSTDADVVRTTFRFLRSEEDDAELGAWEARMARRYYDKLFKEYCIADLSRYREQKIGMRWRVEKEVVTGKGQFSCGEKRCDATSRLASYEVHFGYREAGERKEALVKLRVCDSCARKLNHGRASAFPKVSEASGDGRRRRSGARDGDERRKRRRRDDDDDSDSDSDDDGVDEERREQDAGTGGDGDAVWSGKATVAAAERGDAVWSGKATVAAAEPTREEEFDRYFEDMFA